MVAEGRLQAANHLLWPQDASSTQGKASALPKEAVFQPPFPLGTTSTCFSQQAPSSLFPHHPSSISSHNYSIVQTEESPLCPHSPPLHPPQTLNESRSHILSAAQYQLSLGASLTAGGEFDFWWRQWWLRRQ